MNAERSIKVGPVVIDIRSDDEAPHQIFIRFTGAPDRYYFPEEREGHVVTNPSDGGFADNYVHDLLGLMMFALNSKGIECAYNYDHLDKSFSLIANMQGTSDVMCREAGDIMAALAQRIAPDGSNYKDTMIKLQEERVEADRKKHQPRNKNIPSKVKENVRAAVRGALNNLITYYPKRNNIYFHSADIGDSMMSFINKEGKIGVPALKECAKILVDNYLKEAEEPIRDRLAGEIALKINGAVSHKDRTRRGTSPENSR